MCVHSVYTHARTETLKGWMQCDNWQQVSTDLFYWISLLPLLSQGMETNSDTEAETDALIDFAT